MSKIQGILLLAGIAAVAACWLSASVLNAGISIPILSGLAFVVATSLVVVEAFIHRRSFLGNPIYLALLGYVAFVGIGPLVAPFVNREVSPAGNLWPVGVSWMGLAALVWGYWVVSSDFPGKRRALAEHHSRRAATNFAVLGHFGLIFSALGICGEALYLHSVGGLIRLAHTPYALRPP